MADFTITAVSGKVGSDDTYRGYFNLDNASVPAAFWSDVDTAGATIRVFKGATRLPVDVVTFDKGAETGWLAFRGDFLAASDNEFTVDTNGTPFTPGSDVSLTITNPGAEAGDTTGWTDDLGGLIAREDLSGTGDIPPHSGTFYFAGGDNAQTIAHQDIAIPGAQEADVDDGLYAAELAFWVGGHTDADTAAMEMEFYDGMASQLGLTVRHLQVDGTATWGQFTLREFVPSGTRTIRIIQRMVRDAGTQNNGYVDDITLDLVEVDPNGRERAWEGDWGAYAFDSNLEDRTLNQHDLTVRTGSVSYAVHANGLGGGIDTVGGEMQAANDPGRVIEYINDPDSDEFTLIAVCERTTATAENETAATLNTVYGSSSNRVGVGERDSTGNTASFNNQGTTQWVEGSTFAVDVVHHLVAVLLKSGTTDHMLYVDGVFADSINITETSKRAVGILTVGGGSSTGAFWRGPVAFVRVALSALTADQVAADADQLLDNATFWAVGEVATPPEQPAVTITAVSATGVSAVTGVFVPGSGGGAHEGTDWRITRVSDAVVVYDPGLDTVNKTSIVNAGSTVPLDTANEVYTLEARHGEQE